MAVQYKTFSQLKDSQLLYDKDPPFSIGYYCNYIRLEPLCGENICSEK